MTTNNVMYTTPSEFSSHSDGQKFLVFLWMLNIHSQVQNGVSLNPVLLLKNPEHLPACQLLLVPLVMSCTGLTTIFYCLTVLGGFRHTLHHISLPV